MNRSNKDDIPEAFRERALRCTPQRYAVLDYLMRHVHSTAEEIFRAINRSDPRASRATVYNSLKALGDAGLVRELAVEGGRSARYDVNARRHHHFVCDGCGKVEDIEWFDLPRLPRRSALGARVMRSYDVVFRGACAECSKSLEEEK